MIYQESRDRSTCWHRHECWRVVAGDGNAVRYVPVGSKYFSGSLEIGQFKLLFFGASLLYEVFRWLSNIISLRILVYHMLDHLTYSYSLLQRARKTSRQKHFEPILGESVLDRWQRNQGDARALLYDWERIFQDKMGRVENSNARVDDQLEKRVHYSEQL